LGVEKVAFIEEFLTRAYIWSYVIWELGGTFVGRMEWLKFPGMGFKEFAGFLGLLACLRYAYMGIDFIWRARVLLLPKQFGLP